MLADYKAVISSSYFSIYQSSVIVFRQFVKAKLRSLIFVFNFASE